MSRVPSTKSQLLKQIGPLPVERLEIFGKCILAWYCQSVQGNDERLLHIRRNEVIFAKELPLVIGLFFFQLSGKCIP